MLHVGDEDVEAAGQHDHQQRLLQIVQQVLADRSPADGGADLFDLLVNSRANSSSRAIAFSGLMPTMASLSRVTSSRERLMLRRPAFSAMRTKKCSAAG